MDMSLKPQLREASMYSTSIYSFVCPMLCPETSIDLLPVIIAFFLFLKNSIWMQSGERYFLDGGFHLKLLINLVVKTQNTAEIKSTLRATYNSYNMMLNILTVIFFWVCLYMDVWLQNLWWAGAYLYWACGCNNPIHRGFREGIKRPVRPPHEIRLEKVPGRTEAQLFILLVACAMA